MLSAGECIARLRPAAFDVDLGEDVADDDANDEEDEGRRVFCSPSGDVEFALSAPLLFAAPSGAAVGSVDMSSSAGDESEDDDDMTPGAGSSTAMAPLPPPPPLGGWWSLLLKLFSGYRLPPRVGGMPGAAGSLWPPTKRSLLAWGRCIIIDMDGGGGSPPPDCSERPLLLRGDGCLDDEKRPRFGGLNSRLLLS